MKTTPYKWYSGPNNEEYTGTHDTREGAIAYLEGEGGFICEANKLLLDLSDFIELDIGNMIEAADESARENYGNEDGDPLIELDEKECESLCSAIRQAIADWQYENGMNFPTWTFHDVRNEEHILPTGKSEGE